MLFHIVSLYHRQTSRHFKTFSPLFLYPFTPSRSRWPSDAPTDFHISCAPDVEDNNGFRRPHCLQVLVQMNLCVCRSRHHSLLASGKTSLERLHPSSRCQDTKHVCYFCSHVMFYMAIYFSSPGGFRSLLRNLWRGRKHRRPPEKNCKM